MAVYKHYGKLKKMSNQFETEKKNVIFDRLSFSDSFFCYEKIYFLLNGFFFSGVFNFVDLIFTLYLVFIGMQFYSSNDSSSDTLQNSCSCS